jgi:hypothetical protein
MGAHAFANKKFAAEMSEALIGDLSIANRHYDEGTQGCGTDM